MEPQQTPASLRVIAEAAGVHPSTASRALKDPKSARIADRTVERIRRVAEEHGYSPNVWAKSLRTKRSMMVGLTMPRLTDSGLAQMFDAAQQRALELGYQTVVVASEHATEPDDSVRSLINGRTDGLIISTAKLGSELLDHLSNAGVRFVLLNRSSGDYPGVFSDDRLGGYLATRHLIDLGHRRIGILSGPHTVSTGRLRYEGYIRALTEARIPLDQDLVSITDFDANAARNAAEQLLRRSRPPSAVFAVNDTAAIAAMSVARDVNLTLPDELSVVGYNDWEVSSMLPIPLTTMQVPLQLMGERAVDLLMRLLAGETIGRIVLPPKLIQRDSTAPPAQQQTTNVSS